MKSQTKITDTTHEDRVTVVDIGGFKLSVPHSEIANRLLNHFEALSGAPVTTEKLPLQDAMKKYLEIENKMLKARLEQVDIFKNVPQLVQDNISKIADDSTRLRKEFFGSAEPMINNLVSTLAQEADIINNCNLFHKAIVVGRDTKLAGEKWRLATDGFVELEKLETAYRAIARDAASYVKLLEKRLQQLDNQIKKINPSTSPEAHELYIKLYNASKEELDMCSKYQAEIARLENIEGPRLDKAKDEFNFIKAMLDELHSKPSSGSKEHKENGIQPPSSMRVSPASSTSGDSKDSPNVSPPHSPSSSPSGSPGRSKDSSPIYTAANAKLSSSPQALYGSASQAVQQQQKQKLIVQQQQPSTHCAAAR